MIKQRPKRKDSPPVAVARRAAGSISIGIDDQKNETQAIQSINSEMQDFSMFFIKRQRSWPVQCPPAHRGTPTANATHLAKTHLEYLDVARALSINPSYSKRASAHAGHDPPQSVPVSSPFWAPSEHVGPGTWPKCELRRSSGLRKFFSPGYVLLGTLD